MADIWALHSNRALATAGGWNRVEAYGWGNIWTTFVGCPASGDTVYSAVTFAHAGKQTYIHLAVRFTTITTPRTMTIRLQEKVGSTWTDRTTDTFDVNSTTCPDVFNIKTYALTTYAVDTDADKWRYVYTCSAASTVGLQCTAASTPFYTVELDAATGAPADGDAFIISEGVTLTVDKSFAPGVFSSNNGVLCHGATVQWENPPVSSYTWTPSGYITVGNNFGWNIGTSVLRIPAAQRAIFDFSVYHGALWNLATGYTNGATNVSTNFSPTFYGAYPASTRVKAVLAATAASGQKVITTTTDMSALWTAGDQIHISCAETYPSAWLYTIDTVVGTTVTFTTNLSHQYTKGAWAVNYSMNDEYGISIASADGATSTPFHNQIIPYYEDLTLDGVYMKNITTYFFVSDTTKAHTYTFNNILFNIQADSMGFFRQTNNFYSGTMVMNHFYEINTASSNLGNVNQWTYVKAITANDCQFIGTYTVATVLTACLNSSFTDCMFYDTYESTNSTNYMCLTLSNCTLVTFTRCVFHGGTGVAVGGQVITFDACKFQAMGYALYLASTTGSRLHDCTFGENKLIEYYDVTVSDNMYVEFLFDNCTMDKGVNSMTSTLTGSYLKFQTYDATTNDHRVYKTYGNQQSTGDGLTDTTVHTSGTGKFALRFAPSSSTYNLDWAFNIPTGNIQNYTMFVGVWVKINNAAYYAGTHQLPRLTLTYDDGVSTAYAQAAESTDWQLLFVPITPTTTYGQITATISARTDATTTDAYVYWDDFMVAYPPNVSLDLGGMDLWADALPIVPPLAIPISAKTVSSAVWEELLSAHTTASTFGKQVGSKLLTVAKFLGLK